MKSSTLEVTKVLPRYILFKFSHRKDWLEQLQERGSMYLNKLDFFVQLEKETHNKGTGDIDEAVIFKSSKVDILLPDTNILVGTGKNAVVRGGGVLNQPVYCMTIYNMMDNIVIFNYPKFRSRINFDPLMRGFGDHVLIIYNFDEFLKRIKAKLDSEGIRFQTGIVQYRNTDVVYLNQDGIEINTPFHKNPWFEYQSEFRILLNTEVEDHFNLEIGSIEDISNLTESDKVLPGINCEGIVAPISSL